MKLRSLLLCALLPAALLPAQVTVPRLLSSHMVVQRDLPVHIWGMASPGESVSVAFRGATRTAPADALGRWSVLLPSGAAGGPFQLQIQGTPASGAPAPSDSITLDDVLVGDVWVASGQSNMEFEMFKAATAAQDLPNATLPSVRLLIVKKSAIDYPQADIDSDGWTPSTPDTAKNFSAAAWYFAREISAREHVPVGVIDTSWGGTPVEAWTRVSALAADASLAPLFVAWGARQQQQPDLLLANKKWQQQRADALAQGRPAPPVPGIDSWSPGFLYNGMIAPLTPFAIRGVLWYQGEANTDFVRAPLYGRAFRAMIEDWRRQWAVGDFPFLFVQLANFKSTPAQDWATLRDQQLQTLALRNTGMAVTIDIGNPDNVHPTDKLDVGLRLARAARVLSYGETIEDSGPIFRFAVPEGASMRAWFDHSAGLNVKGPALTGFEVAGSDGKFLPATATIDGSTILASSPQVPAPAYVRYGWANSPDCNLFNSDALPASPFTSVP
jgi:sialate O-acetylesterase